MEAAKCMTRLNDTNVCNLDNVDVLYLENGNVDSPILKSTNRNCFFLKKTFLVLSWIKCTKY